MGRGGEGGRGMGGRGVINWCRPATERLLEGGAPDPGGGGQQVLK